MGERPVTRAAVVKGPVTKALLTKPCCDDDVPGGVDARDPRVALVGNPNVGKSTLFNMLTGARQRIGNWPGKTVSVAQGTWRSPHGEVTLIDLPGTYSLVPGSPDEALTRDLLVDRGMGAAPTSSSSPSTPRTSRATSTCSPRSWRRVCRWSSHSPWSTSPGAGASTSTPGGCPS